MSSLASALEVLDHEPFVEPVEPPLHDPLPLRLIRDELGVDHDVATPDGVTRSLPPLVSLVIGGFVAQAVCTGLLLTAFGVGDVYAGLAVAGQWSVALSVGFFVAICAGLPGYWFHAVVLGVSPPAWRIAVELVRVQAIGSVVLAAVLPLWVAGCLLIWMMGGWLPEGRLLAGNTLPLLCALPGMLGLSRSFTRMAVLRDVSRPQAVAMMLTAWWGVAFLCTAPITVVRLLGVLGA